MLEIKKLDSNCSQQTLQEIQMRNVKVKGMIFVSFLLSFCTISLHMWYGDAQFHLISCFILDTFRS